MFTYERNQPDQWLEDPQLGIYTAREFVVHLGRDTYASPGPDLLQVRDNWRYSPNVDVVDVASPIDMVPGTVGGQPIERLIFSLIDSTGTYRDGGDDSLPGEDLKLSDFDFTRITIVTPLRPAPDDGPLPNLVQGDLTRLVLGDPQVLLAQLVADVIALNLRIGITNALDSKLSAAMSALDDAQSANDSAAVNAVNAFALAVDAQRGGQLTDAQADALVADALVIITLLGG